MASPDASSHAGAEDAGGPVRSPSSGAEHAPISPKQRAGSIHAHDPAASSADANAAAPHVPSIVAPSDLLGLRRPTPVRHAVPSPSTMASVTEQRAPGPMSQVDREQMEGLRAIRAFLRVRTSYDVLPLSFRLIVFDTALLVKKSLNILIQNGRFLT